MIIIGIDAHKRTHTFAAVDELGRHLGHRTFAATPDGHLDALSWASRWPERSFAVEDCRHLTRRLEAELLRAGESLVRVPTRLTVAERRSSRERGKSDPIDALAVARAALREPGLPVARLDGPARELRLLIDHRDDLVNERTRMTNRLRWHLHELVPTLEIKHRSLRRFVHLDRVAAAVAGLDGTVANIARELLERIRSITVRVNDLEREISKLVTPLAPTLLAIHGCGPLTAAKIVAETGDVTRFRSKAAYARFDGTAPIPVWSSNTERFRLNRGGNRQVNAALHRIALVQLRDKHSASTAYADKRAASGANRTEVLRLLRRRLSDVVFTALQRDVVVYTSSSSPDDAIAA